jgi:hypothetical protein
MAVLARTQQRSPASVREDANVLALFARSEQKLSPAAAIWTRLRELIARVGRTRFGKYHLRDLYALI